MLRLTGQFVAGGCMCLLATVGTAQTIRETLVFDRDGTEFDLMGSCADEEASGLWLFVRAQRPEKPIDTLELWFADMSGDDRPDRVHLASASPVPRGRTAGCVVRNGTKLGWHLAGRELVLYRLSLDGLEPLGSYRRWEYPIAAVDFARGVFTVVATDAIGIIDVSTDTVTRHERWTVAAWIEPATGDVYSVRGVEGDADARGIPPVALVREAVLPDGGLRLLASTDPWPAMEQVEEGSIEEIGSVDYHLVATGDRVVLVRSHFLGTGRLAITARDKATLGNPRTFGLQMHSSPAQSGVLDAAAVGGQVVLAVPKYSGESIPVRLLQIDAAGGVRALAAPPIHDGPVLVMDMELLTLGESIYAVATQWFSKSTDESSRPVTIDVFGVEADQ